MGDDGSAGVVEDSPSPAAVAAVRRHCHALRRIRGRLFGDLLAYGDVGDLLRAVNGERTLARLGRTESGIEYFVHGIGCRMTDERGIEVDVDIVDDVEAFDAYRVNSFIDSCGDDTLPMVDLIAACAHLAAGGELRELRTGRWYALAVPAVAAAGTDAGGVTAAAGG
jgi:hypothetical protein